MPATCVSGQVTGKLAGGVSQVVDVGSLQNQHVPWGDQGVPAPTRDAGSDLCRQYLRTWCLVSPEGASASCLGKAEVRTFLGEAAVRCPGGAEVFLSPVGPAGDSSV